MKPVYSLQIATGIASTWGLIIYDSKTPLNKLIPWAVCLTIFVIISLIN